MEKEEVNTRILIVTMVGLDASTCIHLLECTLHARSYSSFLLSLHL